MGDELINIADEKKEQVCHIGTGLKYFQAARRLAPVDRKAHSPKEESNIALLTASYLGDFPHMFYQTSHEGAASPTPGARTETRNFQSSSDSFAPSSDPASTVNDRRTRRVEFVHVDDDDACDNDRACPACQTSSRKPRCAPLMCSNDGRWQHQRLVGLTVVGGGSLDSGKTLPIRQSVGTLSRSHCGLWHSRSTASATSMIERPAGTVNQSSGRATVDRFRFVCPSDRWLAAAL